MFGEEQLIYKNQNYKIYASEGIIFHPSMYNITSEWSNIEFQYESIYKVEEYKLQLLGFKVRTDRGYPKINDISPQLVEDGNRFDFMEYHNILETLNYTGAVVLVNDLIEDYVLQDYASHEDFPCYYYRNVIELIFEEGILVTSINHDRAMNKIRKNINAGLRNPNIKKDARCIDRFIKYSFVGEYDESKRKKVLRVLMKKVKDTKNTMTDSVMINK